MRLTLRTLLAYLDDLLEPAETKEIGEKIKNSKDVRDLIARIQEVMRRRRLTAPDVEGPDAGIDPNTVAEYLDNNLSPEQIVDVEKVYLESDVHLAEVAAIQQIMTLVLGEPVEPSQESLDRMYALLPDGGDIKTNSEGNGQPDAVPSSENKSVQKKSDPVEPVEKSTTQPKPEESLIPEYLKGTPSWKRMLLYGVGIAVALFWIGLLAYDYTGTKSPKEEITQNDQQPHQKIPLENKLPVKKEIVPNVPPKNNDNKPPALPRKIQPPVIAQIPVEKMILPVVPPVVPPKKQPLAAETLQYTSNSGLLLRFDKKKKEWFVMPRRAIIHAQEIIATPQPFSSTIKVGDDLCEVTILGQSTIQTTNPTLKTSWGISLVEGRLLIESKHEPETFPKEGILLRIASHQQVWLLKLTSPKTVCGIEVRLNQPFSLDEKPVAYPYSGMLYVLSGAVNLTDAKGTTNSFAAGFATPLLAEFPPKKKLPEAPAPKDAKGAATTSPPVTALPSLVTLPDWLEYNTTPLSRTTRKYSLLFEKEFDIDQSVALNVSPMVSDSRPKIAELSVQCLALTRNVPAMVEALAQAEHEEARLAAIVGLRIWLGTTPGTTETLHNELVKVFAKDDVDSVYRLLWGYSQKDATDRLIANQLVIWLANDHVAIRELSFYYIQQLAGQTHSYRPLGTPAQRNAAIRRWQDHVEKNNGLKKKN